MTAGRLSRRRVLAGGGATLLAMAGWGAAGLRPGQQPGLSQRLRALFDAPAVLKPFGARAAASLVADPSLEVVVAGLAETTGWVSEGMGVGVVPPSSDALAGALRAAAAEDFRAGDTFVVEGWLLSRTELRLVALAGLDPSF